MTDITKNPPKYHELCRALDCLPVRGCEKDRDIPGISATEKNVLMALAFYYSLGAGVFPTMKALARKISVGCGRTARNTLSSLERKGYIWHEECVTEDGDGKKRQTSNSWYFSDAVFLHASLVRKRQELIRLRQEGASQEEWHQAEQQAETTKKILLQSLQKTRETCPGISVRHGRLGNCVGRMKIHNTKIISLEERLGNTKKPEEQQEIRKLITTQQTLLKKAEKEHQSLLTAPKESYAAPRLLACDERKRAAKKPAVKSTPEQRLCPAPVSVYRPETKPEPVHQEISETLSEPVSIPEPVSVPETAIEPETKNQDYQEFYRFWKEAGGPAIPKSDRIKFELSGIDPKDAIEAAKKLLHSPFLRARFRSVLWLAHLHKEELFEYKARIRVGRSIAELMEHRGLSVDQSLERTGLLWGLDTYHGRVQLKLDQELLKEWIRPWTDPVLEDQKNKQNQPVLPASEFKDTYEDIPF